MKTLIEQLYTNKECESIKDLYQNGTNKHLIQQAIGSKLIVSLDKIVNSKPLDIIYLTCLANKFAASDDEVFRVAITVYHYINKPKDVLPSLLNDSGLNLASKTLMSLSFRKQAMEYNWKYRAAPSPSFYRNISKQIFKNYKQYDIAAHHEQWEGFLGEVFI